MNGNVAFMKKKMKQKNIIISTLLVLSVAIIVATLVLIASGRLVWTGGTSAVAAKPVCSGDIVDRYNDAMFVVRRDGAEEPSIDEAGVKQVTEDIKKTDGYKDDATCQTLLFSIAVYNSDYEAAESAHTKIKSLYDKNIFADSNIRGNQALFSYEQILNGMSQEAEARASDF